MKKIEVYAAYFVKTVAIAEFNASEFEKAKVLVQTLAKNQLDDRTKNSESFRGVELRHWENGENGSFWWGVCPFGQDDDVKLDWPLLITTDKRRTSGNVAKKRTRSKKALTRSTPLQSKTEKIQSKTEKIQSKSEGTQPKPKEVPRKSERIAQLGRALRSSDDDASNASAKASKIEVNSSKRTKCVFVCRWLGVKTYLFHKREDLDKLLNALASLQLDFEKIENPRSVDVTLKSWTAVSPFGAKYFGVCSLTALGKKLHRKVRYEHDFRLNYPHYFVIE